MKVIGAGFGRTGTMSLKIALEQLGLPCYHMKELISHPQHAPHWDAASRGQAVDWDAVFKGYEATVDWPGAAFWRELMQRYPDAKVILTLRSPESWFKSASETIFSIDQHFPIGLVLPYLPGFGRIFPIAQRIVHHGTFGGRHLDPEHAMAVFRAHAEEVQRTVPPERLLVYEVKQGWEPLCAFLGVPVPSAPFPRVNDTQEVRRAVRVMQGMAWILLLSPLWLGLALWWALT